jgi:hypothetical protein
MAAHALENRKKYDLEERTLEFARNVRTFNWRVDEYLRSHSEKRLILFRTFEFWILTSFRISCFGFSFSI